MSLVFPVTTWESQEIVTMGTLILSRNPTLDGNGFKLLSLKFLLLNRSMLLQILLNSVYKVNPVRVTE